MTANRISARRRLSATFFTFASLLALASVPATAETDTDEDVAATDTTADDTAAADQGSYGGDILVTARRRAETAQDVPIAISVVGGDQIDNTGSFTVGRLPQLAPALQYYSSNPPTNAGNNRAIGPPFGLKLGTRTGRE